MFCLSLIILLSINRGMAQSEGNVVDDFKKTLAFNIDMNRDIYRRIENPFVSKIPQGLCAPLQSSAVSIETTNTSATILIDNFRFETTCPTREWEVHVLPQASMSAKSCVLYEMRNLKPFTTYKLDFACPGNPYRDFTTSFTTSEGVPGKVENLRKSGALLMWEPPRQRNGMIRNYKLYYKHLNYVNCDYISDEKAKTMLLHGTATHLDLEKLNLVPYSVYEVQVRAVIIEEGPPVILRITTEPARELNRKQLPNINVFPSVDSATVIIEFDCQSQGGGFDYYLVYCEVDDCANNSDKISLVNNSNITEVTLKDLEPSTKYSLEFKLKRKSYIYKKTNILREFTTNNIKLEPPQVIKGFFEEDDKLVIEWKNHFLIEATPTEFLINIRGSRGNHRKFTNTYSIDYPMKSSMKRNSDNIYGITQDTAIGKCFEISQKVEIKQYLTRGNSTRTSYGRQDDIREDGRRIYDIREDSRRIYDVREDSGRNEVSCHLIVNERFPYYSQLEIELFSKNENGFSEPVKILVYTPPASPKIKDEPQWFNAQNGDVAMSIPAPENSNTNIYVFQASHKLPIQYDLNRTILEVIQKKYTVSGNLNAIKLDLSGIQSGKKRVFFTLKNNVESEFYIVFENEYKSMGRYDTSVILYNPTENYLYYLIFIPIIVLIVGVAVWYYFRRKRRSVKTLKSTRTSVLNNYDVYPRKKRGKLIEDKSPEQTDKIPKSEPSQSNEDGEHTYERVTYRASIEYDKVIIPRIGSNIYDQVVHTRDSDNLKDAEPIYDSVYAGTRGVCKPPKIVINEVNRMNLELKERFAIRKLNPPGQNKTIVNLTQTLMDTESVDLEGIDVEEIAEEAANLQTENGEETNKVIPHYLQVIG